MIIQCEACKTKFRVGDDKVKPPGIKVRCSKCGEVFFFEYSLHEEHSLEAEPNPFNEEQQDEPIQPDIPSIDINETPEVQNKPEVETHPETASSASPETTDEQISTSETKEIPPVSSELQIDKLETSDSSIDIDSSTVNKEILSDSFQNLEIDHLDDMAEKPEAQQASSQSEVFKSPADRQGTAADEVDGIEFQSPDLSIDQDVLEQTYTKGTVASSSDIQEPQYAASEKPASVKRYSRGKDSGFIKKFFGWVFAILLIAALFLVSLFLLNETRIYPNDYFNRFDNYARSFYIGIKGRGLKKNIRIKDVNGSWLSSKYGQVFIVAGAVVNISTNPVNYLKLRVYYISEGNSIFIQELYAGNTLSKREIKNSSFNSLQAKLNRKNGDIDYDDANNLDGLNFDIQPGEKIPFYSIFPAKEKILGLKYRVEVVGYDSVGISGNP